MEQEKWINSVMNSTDGITQVKPDVLLFSKIENKIKRQNVVSNKWIWIAAASFAILFSLNFKVIFSGPNKSNTDTEMLVASIYKSNQLY
ncbi:hypothetical protein SAMN05660845_2426 [Flavobacterium swingsii]|jgi:hypothetical protein|uniref:Uncharacterized protein n=1 Tax=Flavobacterium swingsii TaxID=498292 RepID=A0A1I0ZTG4_9FLAO|nr:hypothetical protein [Flavobacterium swingsii]SFB28955.1 hypothetical protein SAMN05660845_2426 [Flavobacterium swingsii]